MKELHFILIAYWHDKIKLFVDLGLEHQQVIPYSVEERDRIIDLVLANDHSVMLRPTKNDTGQDGIILWIDKYRFGQR